MPHSSNTAFVEEVDFGVPETQLLDNTFAKSKAEAVKQSVVSACRKFLFKPFSNIYNVPNRSCQLDNYHHDTSTMSFSKLVTEKLNKNVFQLVNVKTFS